MRGWVVGLIIAVLVTAGLGVLVAKTSANPSCSSQTASGQHGPVQHGAACAQPEYPLGPGGEPVQDAFYFVRQPLAGNGSITVRVTSLTGQPVPVSWSKAGIIIKDGTSQGSAYAAMMATGGNGVRMQWNYTGDTPGLPGTVSAASPRWLRLTRDGDTLTGYDSADGTHWTRVGTVALAGLPRVVQAGLFVASPKHTVYSSSLGSGGESGGPTESAAVFDHVSRTGTWPASAWTGGYVGAGGPGAGPGNAGYHQVAGGFTVTGSGDIAPLIARALNDGPNITIRDYLIGTFAGLITVAVVATMFMTAEYRRGLIRTTLAASPNRGRMLAAKAIVIGSAAFVAGLAAAAGAVIIGKDVAHSFSLFPELLPVPGTVADRTAHHRRHRGAGRRGRRAHPRHRHHGAPQRHRDPHRDRAGRDPGRPVGPAGDPGRPHRLAAADHPGRRLRPPAARAAVLPVRESAVAIGLVLGLLYVFPLVTSTHHRRPDLPLPRRLSLLFPTGVQLQAEQIRCVTVVHHSGPFLYSIPAPGLKCSQMSLTGYCRFQSEPSSLEMCRPRLATAW